MNWKRECGRELQLSISQTSPNIGPGSYETTTGSKTARTPRVAFGSTANREIILSSRDATPDPGVYEPPPSSSRATSSVFHSTTKRDVFSASDTPSPAAYSQLSDWCPKRKHNIKMKTEHYRPDSPNVGQDVNGYIMREDGSFMAIKKQKKDASYIAPGMYNPDEPQSVKSHTMKESYREVHFDDGLNTPGPGSYNPSESKTKISPQISSKIYSRDEEAPLSGNLTHVSWAKEKRPSSGFKSKSKRECFVGSNETPAPTAYYRDSAKNQKSTVGVGGFGQRSIRFRDDSESTPGPGQYESKPVEWLSGTKTKKGTIRRKPRAEFEEESTPGPGSYNIRPQWGTKPKKVSSFGNSVRSNSNYQDSPGPGSYDIDRSIPLKGMEIHGSRLDHGSFFNSPSRDTPAPGSYNSTSSLSSRGYSIPRDGRFRDEGASTPGPGSYEIAQKTLVKRSYNVDYLHHNI